MHPTQRLHLHLTHYLLTELPRDLPPPADASDAPAAPPTTATRGATRMSTMGAPPSAATPPPLPADPTAPPFPSPVRAAALRCLAQLSKHEGWVGALTQLSPLQALLKAPESWTPDVVQPLAEMAMALLQARLPPPPRAAAARAAAAAATAAAPGGAANRSPQRGGWRPSNEGLLPPVKLPAGWLENGLPAEGNGLAGAAMDDAELAEALKVWAFGGAGERSPGPRVFAAGLAPGRMV